LSLSRCEIRFSSIRFVEPVTDLCRAVYVFSWSPRRPVQCEVQDAASSEYFFLPSWYTGHSTLYRHDQTPPTGST